MPSGKNHDQITWLCLPGIFVSTVIISRDLLTGFVVSTGFLFSGLMFGPDLDIYSVQFKRWGWFKFIWLPYQKILRHRSFFSHGVIIGTVIRVLYLSFIIGIISLLIIGATAMLFPWRWVDFRASFSLKSSVDELIALGVGLELGALSHYSADFIGSWYKKRQKKRPSPQPKKVGKSKGQRSKRKR